MKPSASLTIVLARISRRQRTSLAAASRTKRSRYKWNSPAKMAADYLAEARRCIELVGQLNMAPRLESGQNTRGRHTRDELVPNYGGPVGLNLTTQGDLMD